MSLVILRAGHLYAHGVPGALGGIVDALRGHPRASLEETWADASLQPLHATDLARAVMLAAEKGDGLYHVTANDVRSVAAPDIPTAIEAGVPDMIAYTFAAILAPAGTPRPIVNRIHEATATIMADPAFQKELIGLGAEPIKGSNPDKALKFLQTEVARWRPVILATGTTAR